MKDDYIIIPPLIRVDELEYLKDLQKGNVYMKNSLSYQFGDATDKARTDRFDGSLPSYDNIRLKMPNGQFAENGRIMLINSYIKCFTQCHKDDLQITDKGFRFSLKKAIKEQMVALNKQYAIIISIEPFVERFYSKCQQMGLRFGAYPVQYLDDKMLHEKSNEYTKALLDAVNGISPKKKMLHPVFYKPNQFSGQQEYRLYASFNDKVYDKIESDGIARKEELLELMNTTHTVSIDGGITDISTIVPVEALMDDTFHVIA